MTTQASKKSAQAGARKVLSALAASTAAPGRGRVAALVRDVEQMIGTARRQDADAANAALTTLYWKIGNRVRTEVLDGQRAEYCSRIVSAVGRQLEARP
jgi:hypothetical protein